MPFTKFEDVDDWVAKKGPNGAEKLRGRIASGTMFGQNAILGTAWLDRHDRQQAGILQSEADARAERQTIAAEVSAWSAKRSERWAMLSAFIAVIAVIVSLVNG
jgi:hypothetical protein